MHSSTAHKHSCSTGAPRCLQDYGSLTAADLAQQLQPPKRHRANTATTTTTTATAPAPIITRAPPDERRAILKGFASRGMDEDYAYHCEFSKR